MSFEHNILYALLNADCLDSKYDEALLYLVLRLIDKKRYDKLEIEIVCRDFDTEYGFEVSYFPMQHIFTLCMQQNKISKTRHGFVPCYENFCINLKYPDTLLHEKENNYRNFISKCKVFIADKFSIHFEEQDIEEIVNNFINKYGTLYFTSRKADLPSDTPEDNYMFACYLKQLLDAGDSSIDIFNDMLLGRFFLEIPANGIARDINARFEFDIYLDTGFILRLLGIDELSIRKQYYTKLIAELQRLGAAIKIFDNNYRELIGLIDNSEQWINNPYYNPALATETTSFFVAQNYTKIDIQALATSIHDKLEELNIIVCDMPYPQNIPPNMLHEQDFYDKIVAHYQEQNSKFQEDEKRHTLQCDAKSMFLIDYLNNGNYPQKFSDIKNIFVTTNTSLSRISQKISQNNTQNQQCIYPCVSDIFLGLMVWNCTPQEIKKVAKSRSEFAMLEAFSPSEQLLNKLAEFLKRCEETNVLTPEQCYLVKTNKLAKSSMMAITRGNAELFTETTPLEMLKAMTNEAKEEGRNEERAIAQKEKEAMCADIAKMNDKNSNLKYIAVKNKIKYCRKLIEQKETELITTKIELKKFNDADKNIEDKLTAKFNIITIV